MTFICSGMRRAVQFGGRVLLAVGANEEATNARTRSSLAPSCDVDVLPVTAWETRGQRHSLSKSSNFPLKPVLEWRTNSYRKSGCLIFLLALPRRQFLSNARMGCR